MEARDPTITVRIGGREVSRGPVQAYEARHVDRTLRKLRVTGNEGTLQDRRKQLVDRKLELGHEKLGKILRRETAIASRVARNAARISRGRRRISSIDLTSSAGDAEGFVAWFDRARGTEPLMLAAHPEHYLNVTDDQGRYTIWETNGGSPFAARFQLDFDDTTAVTSEPDPTYPYRVRGVAKEDDGTPIGAVHHQFRDAGTGFEAKLAVEFPLTIPPWIVTGHRWHLAVEWSNWAVAYVRGT